MLHCTPVDGNSRRQHSTTPNHPRLCRFVQLSQFNTPVLKQASNASAFFEHLAAPSWVVEHFANDLTGRDEELLESRS